MGGDRVSEEFAMQEMLTRRITIMMWVRCTLSSLYVGDALSPVDKTFTFWST
jgi:hypothetical protein